MLARSELPPSIEAEVAELRTLYLGCLIDLPGWRTRMRRLGFTADEIQERIERLRD